MAVPKRRTSKTRKRTRQAQQKIGAPNLSKCSLCGAPKAPHILCPNCKSYKGKKIVEDKKEEKEKD
ncbi:MAG: 50S ribosomal protein L32 [Desulfobacterales bacterium]|nr:50S ribosomal protein L32 [Desulfobacterales bacterium]